MAYKIKSVIYSLTILSLSVSSFAESNNCLVCKFPMSNESEKSGQTDACEDLFSAACMGADGKPKFQEASKKLYEDLVKPIREARNKTAIEMGYKDIDDAVKSKLKEAGLILKDPPDNESWKRLIGEADSSISQKDAAKKLYANVEQCNNDIEDLQAIPYYRIDDATVLKKVLAKWDAFQSKYRKQSIKYYARDIPNFISNNIGQKCSNMKSNQENLRPANNLEIVKACEKISQLRREAVGLFRAEGTDTYDKLAEQFVSKNLVPGLIYSSPVSTALTTSTSSPPKKTEIDKLRDKISATISSTVSYCEEFGSNAENTGIKVVADLYKKISKSKTTVDDMVDSVYSKKREELATEIFQSARSDIQNLTRSFVVDSQKRGEILDGYDRLKPYWMKKPDDSAYTKDQTGSMVLDEDKVTTSPLDPTSSIFFDPNLSFFTTLNAFYLPSASFGNMKTDEQVNMLPAFVSMLDKNPYAYLTIVAHEAGHKISPRLGKINGYDLSSEYKDLLACYKDRKSINLQDNQADETLADYFSSEVLAREIQNLPSEKRKQALMSSMEAYCIFDDTADQQHSVMCKESHPENSLRVGGIFGANPSLRKVIGCEGDSSNFKTCGLRHSILDAPETAKPIIPQLDRGGSTDSKPAKGVQ